MSNDYFDSGDYTPPTRNTAGRAQSISDLASALEAAFDLLPTKAALVEGRVTYATAVGGTANAITVTLPTTLSSYTAGLAVLFKPSGDNTSAVTINVDTVGVKSIKLPNGAVCAGGEIQEDSVVCVAYNGTDFILVSGFVSADQQTLAAIAADITTVAGISGNVTTVAGISANVTTVAGVSGNVTTVAGISGNVTTVAGISANVTTVAGISADVTTAATNVADITNFADVYQGGAASDPTQRADTNALQAGDLYFNTTSDQMQVYDGAAWAAAYVPAVGNQDLAGNDLLNIGGVTNVTIDKGSVGTGTVTFNVSDAAKQKLTVTGALTIAFSGWPTTGTQAEVEIELVNGGTKVTWGTINWVVGDGDSSTTFADTGIRLASSGTNHIIVWSTDGGTTLYGVAA